MTYEDWLETLNAYVDEFAIGLLDCPDTQYLWSDKILRIRHAEGLEAAYYATFIENAYMLVG